MIVNVHARNDFAPQDPHNTTLKHTIDASSSDAAYKAAPKIVERVETLVIDDENPGVFVLPSDGTTLVVACGNDDCTLPPNCTTHPEKCDTYQLRLTSPPTRTTVKIALDHRRPDRHRPRAARRPTRITFEQVGGLQASQAFKGNITIDAGPRRRSRAPTAPTSAASSTRASRRACGSGSTGTGQRDRRRRLRDHRPRRVSSLHVVSAPDSARRRARHARATATFSAADGKGVTISQLQVKGVYTGLDRRTPTTATSDTLRPHDGTSWLDAGFLEGQLIQIGALRRHASRSS